MYHHAHVPLSIIQCESETTLANESGRTFGGVRWFGMDPCSVQQSLLTILGFSDAQQQSFWADEEPSMIYHIRSMLDILAEDILKWGMNGLRRSSL